MKYQRCPHFVTEIHYLCRFREGTDSLVTLTSEYYYLELSTLSRPGRPTPLQGNENPSCILQQTRQGDRVGGGVGDGDGGAVGDNGGGGLDVVDVDVVMQQCIEV